MQIRGHVRMKIGFPRLHPVCYDTRPGKIGENVLFMSLIHGEDSAAIFFLKRSAHRIIVQWYRSTVARPRTAANPERATYPVSILILPSIEDITPGHGAIETPAVSSDQCKMLSPRIILHLCQEVRSVHQDQYSTRRHECFVRLVFLNRHILA